MRKFIKLTLCLVLSFSIIFLAACQKGEDNKSGDEKNEETTIEAKDDKETTEKQEEKAEDKEAKKELKSITVILDYVINTNHSGLFLAKERGYYEEAGLDVNIVEPQENASLQVLAAKKADFAISYQEDLTYALDEEEPLPLKAIAAIIQNNTSGFASIKDKNIESTKDFDGITYAGWGSPAETAVIHAAMKGADLDPENITIVTAMDTSYASLKGEVDLMWFFEGWDMLAAEMEGLELNYLPCREIDKRLNYYTPIIVAHKDTIKEDPELVRDFMLATQKAYEEACQEENVDEIVKIMKKYSPELDDELLAKSQAYLAQEYMKGSERWGVMKDEVWTGYADFMHEYELIDEVLAPEEYYTNEFLEIK